jgi:hypothetical protein
VYVLTPLEESEAKDMSDTRSAATAGGSRSSAALLLFLLFLEELGGAERREELWRVASNLPPLAVAVAVITATVALATFLRAPLGLATTLPLEAVLAELDLSDVVLLDWLARLDDEDLIDDDDTAAVVLAR